MKIKYRSSLLITSLLICTSAISSSGSDNKVIDPVTDYALEVSRQFNLKDPSDSEVIKSIRLIRFIADFNADGLVDVAVSDTHHGAWGNAGGIWKIYIRGKDGKYDLLKQTIFFHPLAIHIEPVKDGSSKITTYSRHNVNEGNLIEYQFSSQSLRESGSKTIKSQENAADEREYQKLFGQLLKAPISEFCMLSEYLEENRCAWRKGYY